MLERRNVYALTRGLFRYLLSELGSNEDNKHQNNPRVSALTVRRDRTHIIPFLTRHDEHKDDQADDFYTLTSCLTWSVYVRVMTSQWTLQRWWWLHNRDACTWKVIFNSLDIGDICGRPSKKPKLRLFVLCKICPYRTMEVDFKCHPTYTSCIWYCNVKNQPYIMNMK